MWMVFVLNDAFFFPSYTLTIPCDIILSFTDTSSYLFLYTVTSGRPYLSFFAHEIHTHPFTLFLHMKGFQTWWGAWSSKPHSRLNTSRASFACSICNLRFSKSNEGLISGESYPSVRNLNFTTRPCSRIHALNVSPSYTLVIFAYPSYLLRSNIGIESSVPDKMRLVQQNIYLKLLLFFKLLRIFSGLFITRYTTCDKFCKRFKSLLECTSVTCIRLSITLKIKFGMVYIYYIEKKYY